MGDKKNKFSLPENITNIPKRLDQFYPSLFAVSLVKIGVIDFLRKTFIESSLAIIIDINKKTKD